MPCTRTLQRRPAAAPAGQLQSTHSTLTAAPCSGTNMRASKRTYPTHPILEARTPIASLSGEKRVLAVRETNHYVLERLQNLSIKKQNCVCADLGVWLIESSWRFWPFHSFRWFPCLPLSTTCGDLLGMKWHRHQGFQNHVRSQPRAAENFWSSDLNFAAIFLWRINESS